MVLKFWEKRGEQKNEEKKEDEDEIILVPATCARCN